jgi:hypothetical protein
MSKLPPIPRWNNINPVDSSAAYNQINNALSGFGGMFDTQMKVNQAAADKEAADLKKVKDETSAANLDAFKNALYGAMSSPEALQTGIQSGQYVAMAKAMGVDPAQARGVLDLSKVMPQAYANQAQNEAYDEARQLRAVLPMLQQMENTVRSGTSAAELEPGFQTLVNTGTLSTDMVNKLRKASFVADDQRLAQLDAVTKRTDAAAQRQRTLDTQAEADALKQQSKAGQQILNKAISNRDPSKDDRLSLDALTKAAQEAGLPASVQSDLTNQFISYANSVTPTKLFGSAALAKAAEDDAVAKNLARVEFVKAQEQAVSDFEAKELESAGLQGGAFGESSGNEAVAQALKDLGIGDDIYSKPAGWFSVNKDLQDRREYVDVILDKYRDMGIPARKITSLLKSLPKDTNYASTDSTLADTLDEKLSVYINSKEGQEQIKKIEAIKNEKAKLRNELLKQRQNAPRPSGVSSSF